MDAPAIAMMVISMLVVWGGLAASIAHAVRVSRRKR